MDEPWSSTIKNDTKRLKTTAGALFPPLINDDPLQNILSRLPAVSFASAACVSKSWNQICSRILTRPKLASALSLHGSAEVAVEEVFGKVLAEPIRPHFVVANIGKGFRLSDIFKLVSKKLGSRVPFIISESSGIIGRDALTHEFKEVDLGDAIGADVGIRWTMPNDANHGILLTVGFVPGLKVDAIPLLRSTEEPRGVLLDKFIKDIRYYTESVSCSTSPVGIMMFGDGIINMKPIVEQLDYAMPMETVIVGDEKGCFMYRSENESRNVLGSAKYHAIALTFARDKDKPSGIGDIQFQIAFSKGLSTVGPQLKVFTVNVNEGEHVTGLTARREEGHVGILRGQEILNGINDLLENHDDPSDLYIGVATRRKVSMGLEMPRWSRFLDFHRVVGGDDTYLYVRGVGIVAGDDFSFYRSDPDAELSSCCNLSLKSLKLDGNLKDRHHITEVFGGFIFSCCERGETFGSVNADGAIFVENFPGVPLAGVFCKGQIVRRSSRLTGEAPKDSDVGCILHVCSTVYLVLSYTPASLEH